MARNEDRRARSMSTLPPEHLIDLGACVAVAAGALATTGLSLATLASAPVAIACVLARRRWPGPAAGCGLLAVVIATALCGEPTVLLPACIILIFNVAARDGRRAALAYGAAGVLACFACIAILSPAQPLGPVLLAGIAWPTLAAAAGDATRSRSEVIAAAIERAERAEITHEQEARRRVAEERLHIARELHDLVAHNIAVVNVQSGVAEHFLTADPAAAATALHHVRTSAQGVLDELASILSVLRSDDDADAPRSPTPTVDDIPQLVASFDNAGLDITFETSGRRRPLTDHATLTAYRTTQEALANALKHGTGAVRLLLAFDPDHLTITAENPIDQGVPRDAPSWGYGLTGMRERVATAGGAMATTTRDDTFRLEVSIPYAPPNRSRVGLT